MDRSDGVRKLTESAALISGKPMDIEDLLATGQPDAEPTKVVDPDAERKKQQRIEKEKRDLLDALAGGDFSHQKTRVAHVLNLVPAARNSDIALALKYWELFQPELYNPDGIKPEVFFQLERETLIVRARAKIQNEYGLFQAEEKVRRKRRGREEEMREAVLEEAAPRNVLQVFSDETGKQAAYVIIGSVWVLNGYSVYKVSKAITEWQQRSTFSKREIHFTELRARDIPTIDEYLGVVQASREYLSFKSIAVQRAHLRRSIEETVKRLHELVLLDGVKHEIDSGRVGTPRHITLTVDAEDSLDRIALNDMKRNIGAELQRAHGDAVTLDEVVAVPSKNSPLVQLADMVAGSLNRRLNPGETRNHKDEIADMVIGRLGLALEDERRDAGLDAAVMFKI